MARPVDPYGPVHIGYPLTSSRQESIILVGKTLGHYEILEPLGAGGMGEVYRARDTKLDRDVAIKVLPEDFAADPDRLARFEREAKLLASLNHANIAAIYGLEDEGEQRFIVMEVVEGETIAERLHRSGGIDVDEALDIARQIAEALEAAHENGVIHRDLKPANVIVTPDGKVKVLDFGLAKAYEADGSASAISPDLSHSPTMPAATGVGVIMGTVGYMSPEQAKGLAVDKRADIWALGCVLYEMIVGRQAFQGDTVSETMAAILKDEPAWGSLPEAATPPVRRLLRRTLQKDRAKRFHDAGDVRIEIEEAIEEPAEEWPLAERAVARPAGLSALPWAIAAAATVIAVFALARPSPAPDAIPSPTRFTLPAPADGALTMAFSADGAHLAFAANDREGVPRLWVRDMGSFETVEIPGTEGARLPFFSPNGQSIGFTDGSSRLLTVSLDGGAPLPVPGVQGMTPGAAWGPDGDIVLQPGFGAGLAVIPPEGGEMRALTHVDPARGERHHRYPEFLPGGRHLLFTIFSGINSEKQQIALVSLDGGEVKHLIPGRNAHYVSTGHIVFLRGGTAMAAPFDPDGLEVTGEATVVIGTLADNGARDVRTPPFAVSPNGAIAYIVADTTARLQSELVWVDREGNAQPISEERRAFFMARLSPDGRRLLLSILEEDRFGLWTYDFARGTLARVVGAGSNGYGVWNPDGTAVTFTSDRAGPINVFHRPIGAQSEDDRLASHPDTTLVGSWSRDGAELLVTIVSPDTLGDIGVIRPSTGDGVEILLGGPSDEYSPEFSPNGEWIAYASNESRVNGVYLRSYPDLETKHLVGVSGLADGQPKWSPDGRELFYRSGTSFMVVSVDFEPELRLGIPKKLFDGRYGGDPEGITGYDVSADGSRFVMVRPATDAANTPPQREISVVLNWAEELKQLAPTGR